MWKFLGKIVVTGILVIGLFLGVNYIWYRQGTQSVQVAFEVYDAARLVQARTDYTALVLGDSVARQIFNPNYQAESVWQAYLPTNQAVTPAGNYMLMRKFHENNPQLREVYYIARPDNYFSNVSFLYTYSYFVTPLYNDSFKGYLEGKTRSGLEQIYGNTFCNREFPKWMLAKYPKLLEIYQNHASKKLQRMLKKGEDSPNLSVSYLSQMQEYCRENGITLHLFFSPVPQKYELKEEDFQYLHESGNAVQYEELMGSLYYIDDTEFVDGVHLADSYLSEHREDLKGFYFRGQ